MTRKFVRIGRSAILTVALLSLGCSSDDATFAPPTEVDTVYWRLVLNYQAINLSTAAPYDTVQLAATSQVYNGGTFVPPADVPVTTTYLVSDSAKLAVTSDGMLHARAAGSRLSVIVSRQIGNVTHVDTALVNIQANADTRPLSKFSIQLTDSAKRAQNIWNFPLTALNQEGIPTTVIARTSTPDTLVASPFFDSWGRNVYLKLVGQTRIAVTAWRYGVVYTDTLVLTIGRRLTGSFTALDTVSTNGTHTIRFRRAQDSVGVGAVVNWINTTGAPMDVIFDDPTHFEASDNNPPPEDVESGNVIGIPSGDDPSDLAGHSRYRAVTAAGTYKFHIMPGNIQGVLVVTQ